MLHISMLCVIHLYTHKVTICFERNRKLFCKRLSLVNMINSTSELLSSSVKATCIGMPSLGDTSSCVYVNTKMLIDVFGTDSWR
jgi:hypothetical protein